MLYYHGSHPLPFRSEQVEREGVLRTKLMRERDEVKMAVRHYRFVLLRIRMPDGLILQGEWDRVLMVVHQQKKQNSPLLEHCHFLLLGVPNAHKASSLPNEFIPETLFLNKPPN